MSTKSKKKPLTRSVAVVLDDDVLETLDAARADLAAAQEKADIEYERLLKLGAHVGMSAADLLQLSAGLSAGVDEQVRPHREAVLAAEDAVRDKTRVYRLQSIGRAAYRQLIEDHPPKDEDHEAARADAGSAEARADWHEETFLPALLKACCAEPKLTDADLEEMFTSWNQTELLPLAAAAIAVNTQLRVGVQGRGQAKSK